MTNYNFDESTSKSLLTGLQNEDPKAWGQVAEVYAPLIERWCRQGGAATEQIDEVVQRVLLAVITGFADYRRQNPERMFRKWLWKVTRHKLLDLFREQARNEPLPAVASYRDPTPDRYWDDDTPPTDPDTLSETIRRAMEIVRRNCRSETWQIFLRSTRGEGTTAIIAADFQTTPANVRKIKARYLARLRDVLELRDDAEF